jgi:hypothetical protein
LFASCVAFLYPGVVFRTTIQKANMKNMRM